MSKEKKTYEKPTLKTWGTIVDLTKTGQTQAGADLKQGSVLSSGQ